MFKNNQKKKIKNKKQKTLFIYLLMREILHHMKIFSKLNTRTITKSKERETENESTVV